MKNLHHIAALILVAAALCASCASKAGQLTASEIQPLAVRVCDQLEAYVALGIKPVSEADGNVTSRRTTPEEQTRALGDIVILRNALRAGTDQPLLPLPEFNQDE